MRLQKLVCVFSLLMLPMFAQSDRGTITGTISDPAEAVVTPNETALEEAARTLKRAGGSLIYAAGRPIMREDALRSAGIQDFVYSGCDLPAFISSTYAVLDEPTAGTGKGVSQ